MDNLSYVTSLKKELEPLLKTPNYRTPEDISFILNLTSKVQFFQKLSIEKKSEFIHREACKFFTIKVLQRGDDMARFGEVGEDFFLVLKGKLSVLVPEKVTKTREKVTEKELRRMLSLKTSELQESIKGEITKTEAALKEIFDQELCAHVKILQRANSRLDVRFLKELGRVDAMKEVSVLREGDDFGEIALISEKPTAATVIAKELCVLAVLNKKDFSKIISREAERVLQEKADFLQTLPIFRTVPRSIMMKLSFYFTEHFFRKNQCIYKAGSDVEHVYFVKSGEFKLAMRRLCESKPLIHKGENNLLKFANVREIQQGIDLQFSIKGKNELFGQEEVLENKSLREYTALCISSHGVLYSIPVKEFKLRISNPDSKRYLMRRQDYILQRSCDLSNTEKIFTEISKAKGMNETFIKTEDCYELREKLKGLRERVRKGKGLRKESVGWAYTRHDTPRRTSSVDGGGTARSIFSPPKQKNERADVTGRRIRRVPPPNFMTGMRDLTKVYEDSNIMVLNRRGS